jgi:hypothetical protein
VRKIEVSGILARPGEESQKITAKHGNTWHWTNALYRLLPTFSDPC